MDSYPKISIVVHSYNREQYIGETLDSILDQKYPNLELIVIDDGSNDKSVEIIRSYAPKISYFEQLDGHRDSPVQALDIGFSHATGEIMGWLNAKNILIDKSLFMLAEIFDKNKKVEWITGLNCAIDDTGKIVFAGMDGRKSVYDFLIGNSNGIQQESTFWRRSLWENAGSFLDPRYAWYFDFALWCKFSKYADLYAINTPIGAFRKTAASKSISNRSALLPEERRIFKNFRRESKKIQLFFAYFYKILRACGPLLLIIPHYLYAHIPVLNRYCVRTISYKYEHNTWTLTFRKENPFRPFNLS